MEFIELALMKIIEFAYKRACMCAEGGRKRYDFH